MKLEKGIDVDFYLSFASAQAEAWIETPQTIRELAERYVSPLLRQRRGLKLETSVGAVFCISRFASAQAEAWIETPFERNGGET